MLDYWLANAVIAIHFLFVLFVILGGVLLLWSKKIVFFHIPAAIWGALVEFTGWICPLTPLENALRFRAGRRIYETGFIENYIVPVLYPAGLTRNIQTVLGILVIAINGIVYWYVFIKRATNKRQSLR